MEPLPHPLALEDMYVTPPTVRRTRWRLLLPTTPAFYVKMMKTVLDGSRLAKHGYYDTNQWLISSWRILRCLESVGVGFHIEGMRNITSGAGPVVFVGNHMSTLETFVLPIVVQPVKPITFVVKPSLIDYPFFGHVMRSRNPIVVSRDNPRADLVTVLEKGLERLRDGVSVVLFPQTTRAAHFDPAQFNSLGTKLAKNAGVPVIPVAMKTDAWGNGRRLKDFGPIRPSLPVHISFGEPIVIEGNGKAEHEAVISFIERHLKEWNSGTSSSLGA